MSTDREPATAVLVIAEPVMRDGAPALCERLCALLRESDSEVIVIDVRGLPANANSIEAIVRLQLAARQRGREVRLHRVSRELDALVSFVGLDGVVETVGPGSGRRGGGQAEQREHPRRVEERLDRDDVIA